MLNNELSLMRHARQITLDPIGASAQHSVTIPKSRISSLRRLTRWGPSVAHSHHRWGAPDPSGSISSGAGLMADEVDVTGAAASAAAAMAAAVRRQLTIPGSVSPDEQLRLLLADRRSHQLCGSVPPPAAWGTNS